MLVLTLFALLLEPLQNMISRRYERQCDRYALDRTGLREAYVSAFRKLARLEQDDPDPHPLEVFWFPQPPANQRAIGNGRQVNGDGPLSGRIGQRDRDGVARIFLRKDGAAYSSAGVKHSTGIANDARPRICRGQPSLTLSSRLRVVDSQHDDQHEHQGPVVLLAEHDIQDRGDQKAAGHQMRPRPNRP